MSIRTGAISLFVALALAAVAAPGAGAAEPSFCRSRTLHDYLAPFDRMPKLRERPYRARSEPFFHGVRIGAAGPSLAINGGRAGYQLEWERGNPGWNVTVTFAQVNRNGSVIRQIGTRHSRLAGQEFGGLVEPSFGIPSKPALYRTILKIRSRSGRKIATFGNYYRVVRPAVHNRLEADASSYRPGETLLARIENPGASYVLFGEEFKVKQRQGESWLPAPEPGPFPAPIQFIAPGTTSGPCLSLPITASMPTGSYRVSLETVLGWPGMKKEIRPVLYAEFEVAA